MRLLKQTIEYVVDTEEEAKNLMEELRAEAAQKGFTIGACGFTRKEKKAQGEIVAEAFIVKVVQIFSGVWDEE